MAIIQSVNEKSIVFYQSWSEDNAGEPAIIITPYSDSIGLVQEEREILISKHELKAFIKQLQKLL
jgi:hypothetical protein